MKVTVRLEIDGIGLNVQSNLIDSFEIEDTSESNMVLDIDDETLKNFFMNVDRMRQFFSANNDTAIRMRIYTNKY